MTMKAIAYADETSAYETAAPVDEGKNMPQKSRTEKYDDKLRIGSAARFP